MNYVVAAWQWLAEPINMNGPNGWESRMVEHLWYTALATVIACLIGIRSGTPSGMRTGSEPPSSPRPALPRRCRHSASSRCSG